ncbi:hypothetical protein BABINDRAFT_9527 [Babjeviella inositovora NRRL Y-12698]|uniref:Centrosomin N-terminal motif 1 domain-containing protein n=1 Tax=Babjeviella inositovora NRRL Y-12698 TaxID=984486 RepID=A0A1E3QKV9_9ASCO|nr:uncharacterized protein BABINDRAFT_9527 [Babjeviella inositovora NRRL Y-12698]ODQ78321.1 hypothetical protein BABINDRAFT_9527 [Babjeviella inositovora NRRL Y-12698]
MFSKPLIGTPGRRSPAKTYEFTPVGGVSQARHTAHTPLTQRNASQPSPYSPAFDAADRTADETFDTINGFDNHNFNTKAPAPEFAYKPILNEGSNLVKEQQENFQRLENENYNLKIKLATLNRYLGATPAEQRQVVEQNIELKQRLLEMSRALDSDKENSPEKGADSREERIASLGAELEMVLGDLEALNDVAADLETENTRLERKNLELNRLLEVTPDQAAVAGLKEEAQKYRGMAEDLQYELRLKEVSIEELQDQLRRRELTLDDLHDQLRQKDVSLENLKQRELSLGNLEGLVRQKELALVDLQEKLRRTELALDAKSQRFDEQSTEIAALRTKLDNVHSRSFENTLETTKNNALLRQLQDELEKEVAAKDAEQQKVFALREQLTRLEQRCQALVQDLKEATGNASENNVFAERVESLERQLEASELAKFDLQRERALLREEVSLLKAKPSGTHLTELRLEIENLTEKLRYYETEYETLERELTATRAELNEIKSLAQKGVHNDALREARLEEEMDVLRLVNRKLTRELETERLSRSSDLREYERDSRRKITALETEISRLGSDQKGYASLEAEISRLNAEAENYASLEAETSRLNEQMKELTMLAERNELKYEDKIGALEREKSRLVETLDGNEREISMLEDRLREIHSKNKFSFLNEDSEKLELVKLKALNESKIRMLSLENDTLQKEFSSKLDYYEKQLANLQEDNSKARYNDALRDQLAKATKAREDMAEKLSEVYDTCESLKWESSQKTNENALLRDIVKQLQETEELLKHEVKLKREDDFRFDSELASDSKDAKKLAREYAELKETLMLKCRSLYGDKASLNHQVEVLTEKLTKATLQPSATKLHERLHLLESELHFFKAKLYEASLYSNDLTFVNQYVLSRIQNSSRIISNDALKLQAVGVYPAPRDHRKPVSFKAVALMVLAMVRLRRRGARRVKREAQMDELRKEIQLAKIVLLE